MFIKIQINKNILNEVARLELVTSEVLIESFGFFF